MQLLLQSLDGNYLDCLTTLKIGGTSVCDEGLVLICEFAPKIEHIELNKLNLTEETVWKVLTLEKLKFIDF